MLLEHHDAGKAKLGQRRHHRRTDGMAALRDLADVIEMADRLGSRLRHVHLTDGSGSAKDEHLVPGRGSQPCAEVLQHVATSGFEGAVVLEVGTRKRTLADREGDLAESLAFAREHLGD